MHTPTMLTTEPLTAETIELLTTVLMLFTPVNTELLTTETTILLKYWLLNHWLLKLLNYWLLEILKLLYNWTTEYWILKLLTAENTEAVTTKTQSCARVMTVESSPESHVQRLESLLFPVAESQVESRVISLESESSQVIAKVSRVIIAQLVVST